MEELKPISCRIPEHLKRQKKTQQWLADRVGLSKQLLSDYIHMRSVLGVANARRIAQALGVTIEELYVWE